MIFNSFAFCVLRVCKRACGGEGRNAILHTHRVQQNLPMPIAQAKLTLARREVSCCSGLLVRT